MKKEDINKLKDKADKITDEELKEALKDKIETLTDEKIVLK